MQLRPAQEAILAYEQGRMAVAAVPGSGKTFTLTLLAARLISEAKIDPYSNQQVLIVTYLNASVDNFKARIREQLQAQGVEPALGYHVSTLHSLGLEIVRFVRGAEGNDLIVLDEPTRRRFLLLALDNWRLGHSDLWELLSPQESPQAQTRWRTTVESMADAFIRTAKNERYTPEKIQRRLGETAVVPSDPDSPTFDAQYAPLLKMLSGIYLEYQLILVRQGAMDFDDLIGEAADLLENRPDVAAALRQRWPYVLEDEAQDSVPLQEVLLGGLTGEHGNWVRVGDPNQAITSTFTAAHPRYLNQFLAREDVIERPLPNSGRSALKILTAANRLVDWTLHKHPEPEVRQHAFRDQQIHPTPPGDAQPNPPDAEAKIVIKVYGHREDEELPKIARLAHLYTQKFPERTVAILTPTNDVGHKTAEHLDQLNASYDNLLRGGSREREIASALHAILALLANPLDKKALQQSFQALHAIDHPAAQVSEADLDRLLAVLRSTLQPERLLYPETGEDMALALPSGRVDEADLGILGQFVTFLQSAFRLRLLPIDDLIIALADELFAHREAEINETDLAIAYQIANVMRSWYDMDPSRRLPELAAQLADVVEGRRQLRVYVATDGGYEPEAGRITLTTMHSSKGLEWDAVFLVGVDGRFFPGSLDAYFIGVDREFGVNLKAEVTSQLNYLMIGEARLHPGYSATESSHIEIICERLRLLYVGITRARRFLHISRSRTTRTYAKEVDAEPATALGVLYRYVKRINNEQ